MDWSRILNAPELGSPLSIAAMAVLFSALDAYQKSVLIGLESMRAFAIGTVAGVLVAFPIMLIAASHFSLLGTAVAMAFGAMCQCAISRFQMGRELKKFGLSRIASGSMREWPILWKFALPALLAGVLVTPIHWAVQSMLVNTPNGYNQLAVLGVAMQWFNVIMFLPSTVSTGDCADPDRTCDWESS